MRRSEFEQHLQLVRDHESHDSISNASSGGGEVRPTEEQLLSWAFREIGAHIQQIPPSLEVEQRVMKAFDREQRIKQRYSRLWPRYAAGIAAALLFVAGVSFALFRNRTSPAPPGSKSSIDLSAATATAESLPAQTSLPSSQVKPKPFSSTSRLARSNIHRAAAANEVAAEITTDFIRLSATPIEPGDQIVRVQLPRSAMAQFGLPVNMDRSDKPVKADVIMGIDGVAQAIRFVQ